MSLIVFCTCRQRRLMVDEQEACHAQIAHGASLSLVFHERAEEFTAGIAYPTREADYL